MTTSTSPSYVLRVRERFEAAHHLRSYRGAPEPVHGHSWQVEVVLRTHELDDEGMGFDFVAIKKALGDLVAPFHHNNFNTVPPFDEVSPTTENIARHFCRTLQVILPDAPIVEVTVWEGPDCSASFIVAD